MENLQVVIPHYGDRELLEGCLPTVVEKLPETPVHVVDGRYAHFDIGLDSDLTPGTEDLCNQYENVHYHAPPDDLLPFGHERPEGRYPMNQKGAYVWYEVADPDRWALKIDADERLRKFEFTDAELDDLNPEEKVLVELVVGKKDHVENARMWVPRNWTFYVGDICYPRSAVSRDTPFEELREICGPDLTWTNLERYEGVSRVSIRNLDHERTEPWTTERQKVKDEIRRKPG